ncbi:MAG: threonine/serine exporter family protein [Lachnospiraceae bacterium]|nr:threonine/serine exporter family protein [Lachnospiraceae bacterium]
MNPELVVRSALDIGEEMLISGAETVRVEDTISRICHSYYDCRVDVTSYMNAIFVSMDISGCDHEEGCPSIVTQTRRVLSTSNDFSVLEDLNTLSRYICSRHPEYDEICERIAGIKRETPNPYKLLLGYIMSAAFFAVMFGGSWLDALCSGLIAVCIFYLKKSVDRRLDNQLIRIFILALACGVGACLLHISPIPVQMDMIMIGNVMLLIPGLALTNSLRDLMTGDIVSGTLKLVNSLLIAVFIACGFVLSMMIFQV